MSVYQVEQFYIHISTEGFNVELIEKIKFLLIENDWQDYEFQEGALVVDGFEGEYDALGIEELIQDLITESTNLING